MLLFLVSGKWQFMSIAKNDNGARKSGKNRLDSWLVLRLQLDLNNKDSSGKTEKLQCYRAPLCFLIRSAVELSLPWVPSLQNRATNLPTQSLFCMERNLIVFLAAAKQGFRVIIRNFRHASILLIRDKLRGIFHHVIHFSRLDLHSFRIFLFFLTFDRNQGISIIRCSFLDYIVHFTFFYRKKFHPYDNAGNFATPGCNPLESDKGHRRWAPRAQIENK